MEYNPEEIPGPWRSGFALDRHTVSSEYLGDDSFGNPIYDTVRSPLGEQLFKLKYRGDESAIAPIIEAVTDFLKAWKPDLDLLIPTPPSNEDRKMQPVRLIANALSSAIGIELCDACVSKKTTTAELKNVHVYSERVKILREVFSVDELKVKGRRVLVLDDLFRSGATLSALTEALYNSGARDVYVMTITKTRVRS